MWRICLSERRFGEMANLPLYTVHEFRLDSSARTPGSWEVWTTTRYVRFLELIGPDDALEISFNYGDWFPVRGLMSFDYRDLPASRGEITLIRLRVNGFVPSQLQGKLLTTLGDVNTNTMRIGAIDPDVNVPITGSVRNYDAPTLDMGEARVINAVLELSSNAGGQVETLTAIHTEGFAFDDLVAGGIYAFDLEHFTFAPSFLYSKTDITPPANETVRNFISATTRCFIQHEVGLHGYRRAGLSCGWDGIQQNITSAGVTQDQDGYTFIGQAAGSNAYTSVEQQIEQRPFVFTALSPEYSLQFVTSVVRNSSVPFNSGAGNEMAVGFILRASVQRLREII